MEILLRAWDKDRMVYQGEPDLETLQSFIFHYGDRPLMLWTGQTDDCEGLNKRKVFVGDILKHNYSNLMNWLVTSKYGCIGIQNIGIDGYLGDFFYQNSPYFYADRTIIGNIYEHKHLIK